MSLGGIAKVEEKGREGRRFGGRWVWLQIGKRLEKISDRYEIHRKEFPCGLWAGKKHGPSGQARRAGEVLLT